MNFKEKDIRPEHLINKQIKFLNKDINFLKKNKKNFVKVNCPACSSKLSMPFLKKKSFNYQICKKCKTFYMSPRPNKKLLKNFYNNSDNGKYWNDYIFPLTDKIRAQKIFRPRVKQIIKISKNLKLKKPLILDVGSGYGTFCVEAKKKQEFSDIYAIEPSESGYRSCKKNKVKVFKSINEIKTINKKFDIITSFEVIEHLYSIKEFINEIKPLMKVKGILILTFPNGEGFDVRVLMKNSKTIDHEHLNYLNIYSVNILLKELNFKVKEIFTPGKLDLDIVKNALKKSKKNSTNNFFLDSIIFSKNKKIESNFQKFLIDNKLSSNMWVVAQIN